MKRILSPAERTRSMQRKINLRLFLRYGGWLALLYLLVVVGLMLFSPDK